MSVYLVCVVCCGIRRGVASVPRGGTKTPHLLMLLRMTTMMMVVIVRMRIILMFLMVRMRMTIVMKIRQGRGIVTGSSK